MTTRADFYIGRGNEAQWIGSIACDGYPDGLKEEKIFETTTIEEYKTAVETFLVSRQDATFPTDGWPWPWEDSSGTDYAYAFDKNKVYASNFGSDWFDPLDKLDEVIFPNMKAVQNIAVGKRSGCIIFGG